MERIFGNNWQNELLNASAKTRMCVERIMYPVKTKNRLGPVRILLLSDALKEKGINCQVHNEIPVNRSKSRYSNKHQRKGKKILRAAESTYLDDFHQRK